MLLDAATRVLLLIGPPAIKDLVAWLSHNMDKKYEKIVATQWLGDVWYIEVRDTRESSATAGMKIWFSVNITTGVIVWNNMKPSDDLSHGNCGLRSLRWLRLLNRKFPGLKKCGYHNDKSGHYDNNIPKRVAA